MEDILIMVGIFAGLQIVNVVLNTLKTLVMAKTDNCHASAITNAVAFGFYVAVVQQISSLPLVYTVPVTMITNIIGVYITFWIMKKVRKDALWKVEIYCPPTQYSNANFIRQELEKNNVPCREDNLSFVTAFCYTQNQSAITADIIKRHGAKYNITEITKKF